MSKDKPFHNPFGGLAGLKKELKAKEAEKLAPKKPAPAAKPKPAPSELSDEELFLRAVDSSRPIARRESPRVAPRTPPAVDELAIVDEEAEALLQLNQLVEGKTTFDISDGDEYIEGAVAGLDRRILRKLRAGELSFQDHVDLHGMTREVAKDEVERFLVDARKRGQRTVLVVHGRGHNSKDNIPVLKNALKAWLERGRISRNILAFCTARPHDGGAGALYVLLRR